MAADSATGRLANGLETVQLKDIDLSNGNDLAADIACLEPWPETCPVMIEGRRCGGATVPPTVACQMRRCHPRTVAVGSPAGRCGGT